MFSDVQSLKNGRYHQAEHLHTQVHRLHQRCAGLNQSLQSSIMVHLTTDPIDLARESIAINTAASAAVAARRVGRVTHISPTPHTNGTEAFHMAQEILAWISAKTVELEGTGYGKDLESCQDSQEYHASVNREIMAYTREVDKCVDYKVSRVWGGV